MTAPQLTSYQNGQNQVSGDQLNTFVQTANSVAQLRAFIGLSGMEVALKGFSTPNDGGQGVFYWNATGTGPDDGGVTNVVPNGAAIGCWTRISNNAVGIAVGNARFNYTSSTVCTLSPYQGNSITFPSGLVAVVSAAGISTTITNSYINGVSGQTLVASTLYYAYLASISGSYVIDWSITGYATDASSGITVKSGDSTRVLVGMVFVSSGVNFTNTTSNRGVISYFNRLDISLLSTTDLSGETTTSTSFVELSTAARVSFCSWAGENTHIQASSLASNGTNGDTVGLSIGINSAATAGLIGQMYSATGGQVAGMSAAYDHINPEGFNYAAILGNVNAGTGTFTNGGLSGFIRG